MILKNLSDKNTKVDMSSRAITARLQRVSQLRRLCISLGHAERSKASDTHFSILLENDFSKNEVIIAKEEKPTIKILPFTNSLENRKPGLGKGKIIEHGSVLSPMPNDFWGFFS